MSSFVITLPLRTSLADEKQLETRFAAAKQIYNASLGEALRILDLMRESKDWQAAKKLPRTLKKGKQFVPNPERSKAFKAVIERFDFKESAIHRFAITCKNECWIGDHLGAHDTQKIATRAFSAAQSYSFGKRGRPRLKGQRGLHSVDAKSNAACIRWRHGIVYWGKLMLPAILPPDGKDVWLEQALQADTAFCRILRRITKGRQRWFVQLVQKGVPPWKKTNSIGSCATVGLDIGPSTIAIVGTEQVSLRQFCSEVQQPWSRIKKLQRAMDRSKRATNPGHYESDHFVRKDKRWVRKRGKNKKGFRSWQFSKQYQKIRALKAETERRLAETRKTSHGRLINNILAQGNIVKTESLSYRSFQKNFGRSVTVRGPGLFVCQLKRKAENAGGQLVEFPTRTTKLSQYCQGCDTYTKKPLSQRIHHCQCGFGPLHVTNRNHRAFEPHLSLFSEPH